MFLKDDDYSILIEKWFIDFFLKYFIVVGFIGNLGFSIGIIGVKFGFCVIVYMFGDVK